MQESRSQSTHELFEVIDETTSSSLHHWLGQEGLFHQGNDLCHVSVSIVKFYQDIIACDVIDMGACHVLLGRPWQHDVDATHRDKESIYVFPWKDTRVVMRPILPAPKPTQEEKPKFIFICNRGEFLVELKETK